MAQKFKKIPKIAETQGSNFGNYSEANGGGSPKGGVWGGQSGRVGWENRKQAGEVKEGESRKEQPRDKAGHFTYNSVNGKETLYPGRGDTVNPLLTGGDGTIHISDVVDKRTGQTKQGIKSQFAQKSGAYYDKWKSVFYQKGSELITKQGKKFTTKLASDDVWEIGRRNWDAKKGEFKDEGKTFEKGKVGAPSKAQKQAMAFAKKNKEETFVKTPDGAIKVKGDQALPDMEKALKKVTGSQLKHSPAQIKAVRDLAASKGLDFSAYTDEQIDQIVDQYISF